MKTWNHTLLFAILPALLVGCGDYKKQPVSDINTLRQNAKNSNPDAPSVQYVSVPTEHDVVKEHDVTKYQTVDRMVNEAKIDASFLAVVPDAEMTFIEGQKATFKIQTRVTLSATDYPGLTVKLTKKSGPDDLSIALSTDKSDAAGTYIVSWTPALYTVAENAATKSFDVTVTAAFGNIGANEAALQTLARDIKFPVYVMHNQTAPNSIKVEGLPSTVQQGTVTNFDVTVQIPGVDGSSSGKPQLVIFYDGVGISAGNDYLEGNGSVYVMPDTNQTQPTYVGNSTWKFNRIFDTKNVQVQPAQARNGTATANATDSHVRFSIKVLSPLGSTSADQVEQVQIHLTAPAQPAPAQTQGQEAGK